RTSRRRPDARRRRRGRREWPGEGRPPGTALPALRLQFHVLTIEYLAGQVCHGDAAVHGPALEATEGLWLGPAVVAHQHALGAFDGLAIGQGCLEPGVVGAKALLLLEEPQSEGGSSGDLGTGDRLEQISMDWQGQ